LQRLWSSRYKGSTKWVYQSIDDLPIKNWFKIFETNEYSYLVYGKKKYTESELAAIWAGIMDEYMLLFGMSKEMINYIMHTKRLIGLEIDSALADDDKKKSIDYKIKFEKAKFKELNPVKEEQDNYMEIVAAVETARGGHQIDENTTTVRKFYTYLKQLESGEAVKR